ncbi:MAG: DUF3179 domain-containing protein [Stappiaceae bacterium]
MLQSFHRTFGQGVLAVALAMAASNFVAAAENAPADWTSEWPKTDFSKNTISFDEVLSGGVPKDGIPALYRVEMLPAAEVSGLDPAEPVVTVKIGEAPARAYPIRYLTWHEIVNDDQAPIPIAVTFCPLCNSALVFDRRVDGQVLSFGVSGKLRHSDMVMYDRQTQSWWQQFTGEAIVGELTGAKLDLVVSWMESWEGFKNRESAGLVMQEPTGHARPYGNNPYVGYDSSGWPFLYQGEKPPHDIEPLARVIRVGDRAWPLDRLAKAGAPIVEDGLEIRWQKGMTSALDGQRIGHSRDVGQIRVKNVATGSDVPHEVVFAFAFHAFTPNGKWMLGR